jgi:hypothetical protein
MIADNSIATISPFLIVLVESDDISELARMWVEAATWSKPTSVQLGNDHCLDNNRGVLVGDQMYFMLHFIRF